ncbi:FxLD family lanthipeptide [Streptomyces sp. NPDC093221]|uniref:FxLD family lanthipeptide n=1 Tax=Streptomyces sp. NPDC093221 TaxID=3366032 RepID=UPI0037FE209C
MANITHTIGAGPATVGTTAQDDFELDVTLVEIGDTAGLVNLTDDGCGSTCGACVSSVA